jgi:thiamine biosynthesis lipoprotein
VSTHRGAGEGGGRGRGADTVRLALPTSGETADAMVARHETQIMGRTFAFILVTTDGTQRREVSVALAAAVAELRAVEYTFSPRREESLVSMLRRDELRPEAYPPPLADIVSRCAAMRTATEGWFDAWAVPGGFDPGGMVTGWGIERAAGLLRSAGLTRFAVCGGGDILVRGLAPDARPWRVEIGDTVLELADGAVSGSCPSPRGARVVNPHTGDLIDTPGSAAVAGPDLCVADAYATALYAAGPVGLGWFPTLDGYTGYLFDDDRPRPEPVTDGTAAIDATPTDEAGDPAPAGKDNRNAKPARTPRQRATAIARNNKAPLV